MSVAHTSGRQGRYAHTIDIGNIHTSKKNKIIYRKNLTSALSTRLDPGEPELIVRNIYQFKSSSLHMRVQVPVR